MALLQLLGNVNQKIELLHFWAGQGRARWGPALPSRFSCKISVLSLSRVEKLKMELLQLLGKAGQEMELLPLLGRAVHGRGGPTLTVPRKLQNFNFEFFKGFLP